MNGQTAKLLRKTSGGDRAKYKIIKRAYTASPQFIRAQGKRMAKDLAQVERAEAEIRSMQAEKAKNPDAGKFEDGFPY